jgi:high-affinity iron transporter
MLAQFLLVFREVLEAALITSIVLAYLDRTGRGALTRFAWYGVVAAASLSIALGIVVWSVYGALSEAVQVLFEGSSALVAVAVLSWMLYWMAVRGRELRGEVERRIEEPED